jgi:hypothetical protein
VEESSEEEELESSGDDEEGDEEDGAPMDADGQQVCGARRDAPRSTLGCGG